MISAFGVEHGISKSLVGGVFKPASKLTRAERGAVGGYKKARGVTAADQEFKHVQGQTKAYHAALTPTRSFKSKSGTTHVYEHNILSRGIPKGAAGFHVREGGKQGTSHVHYRSDKIIGADNKPKSTLMHEMAHARPARSSYRMNQIIDSPKKLFREEGRADFESRGHFKKRPEGGYAQAAMNRVKTKDAKKLETRAKTKLRKIPIVGRRLGAVMAADVRSAAKPMRQQHKAGLRTLSQTMGKPIGNKEVDSYIGVHDKMKRAKKRG